jgi:glycosyltransferase involved in cell wall biosynthesis
MAKGVLRVPRERREIQSLPEMTVFHVQFKREQVALTRTLSRKAPVVWTEHGRWIGGLNGRLLMGAYRRAARHAARIVCVSPALADDLRPVVDPSKIVVIPNSICAEKFAVTAAQRAAARARLLPEWFLDRPVAVLASRLHPAKHHDRALAAAMATGTPLVIIGDGPDRARLEAIADGHRDVLFVGHHRDVREWLAAADIYFYCGARSDGMPTALLEAAAAGLGILGFEGDPGTEFVEACGGAVVPDADAVTAGLVRDVVANAGAGVAYVQRHHARRAWLDAYETVFREAVA